MASSGNSSAVNSSAANSSAANSPAARPGSSSAAKSGDGFADGFGGDSDGGSGDELGDESSDGSSDESGDSSSETSGGNSGNCSSDDPGNTAGVSSGDSSGDGTNICCYFRDKDGRLTWQWGLVPGTNAWFSVPGHWGKGERTGVARFVANGSVNEARILEAAVTAQNYYKLQDYHLVAVFAAKPGVARNYPLIVQGKELYPER
jgi:hypothetical protein